MIWEASAARSFQQICFGHANDKYCPILLISTASFPEICIEHLNIFPVIQAKESLNKLNDTLRSAGQFLVQMSHFPPLQGSESPSGWPALVIFCSLKHK